MLHAGKRQRGVTLYRWLLRGPSYRAMLLTNPTEARVPRPLGRKQSGTVGTRTTSFVCGKQGHTQWDCPQSQQGKAGKGVHCQSHGQDPKQQQHQQQQQQRSMSGPAQHTRKNATGMAPASATLIAGASGYKSASKVVVTGIEPATPAASTEKDDNVYIPVPRQKVAPVDTGRTETVQHHVSQSAGPQKVAPVLQSVPVQPPAPASQQCLAHSGIIS